VEPGLLAFAITPWGEVYVDGKKLGVSPPLQEIQIGPGRHRIEIRNTTFPPHVQTVEVKTGERIRIRHLFR
jgi:serine/threonine-protein kinase